MFLLTYRQVFKARYDDFDNVLDAPSCESEKRAAKLATP